MTLVFRPAARDEVALVQALSAAAYIPAYQAVIGAVPKPATEDYAPRIGQGHVWLAREAETGGAVGVLVMEPHPDHMLIYSVAVSPGHQGKEHGSALLTHAATLAETGHYRSVRLYTNTRMTRNIKLYRRNGFVVAGERPHPSRPGDILVDMVRHLGAAPCDQGPQTCQGRSP